MYELQVRRAHKALGLARQIVGVRFLVMQKEYEDCRAVEVNHTSICSVVREAGNGMRVKAKADNFQCMNAAYAVGLREIPADVSTGRCGWNTSFLGRNRKGWFPLVLQMSLFNEIKRER